VLFNEVFVYNYEELMTKEFGEVSAVIRGNSRWAELQLKRKGEKSNFFINTIKVTTRDYHKILKKAFKKSGLTLQDMTVRDKVRSEMRKEIKKLMEQEKVN